MFKKKIKLKEIVSKRQLNRRINATFQSGTQIVCNNSLQFGNSCLHKSMQVDNSCLNHSLHFENNCFDNPLQVDNSCPSNNILEGHNSTTDNISQLTNFDNEFDNQSNLLCSSVVTLFEHPSLKEKLTYWALSEKMTTYCSY